MFNRTRDLPAEQNRRNQNHQKDIELINIEVSKAWIKVKC
jgi:hypothetical protein